MKTVSKSIAFTPSKTLAPRLEELGRISQLSTDQILNDVLGGYFDQVFGEDPDTDLLASHISGYAHPSHKKAKAIATAYNAFSLAVAHKANRTRSDRATVVKDSKGVSRVQVHSGKPLKKTARRAVAS